MSISMSQERESARSLNLAKNNVLWLQFLTKNKTNIEYLCSVLNIEQLVHSFMLFISPRRFHVSGGLLYGSNDAQLVYLARQTVHWKSYEQCGKKGTPGPAVRLTTVRDVVFCRWVELSSSSIWTYISTHLVNTQTDLTCSGFWSVLLTHLTNNSVICRNESHRGTHFSWRMGRI